MITRMLATLLLAVLGVNPAAQAQPEAVDWQVVDARTPQVQAPPGWHCPESVVLSASKQWLAACRRTGAEASAELWLLLVERTQARTPRVRQLARLRDATHARMRLFKAAPGCRGSAQCLSGIVLVDQRDESSCYGTQVVVMPAGREIRAAGFIDEVRGGDEAGACIGPWANVRTAPGGAMVTVPAPLMTVVQDGDLRELGAPAVRYLVTAARPALQRQVVQAP